MFGDETVKKDDKLFSASELGEFTFCSVSWFLKRKGCTVSRSKKKSYGVKMHDLLGKKTHRFQVLVKLSYYLIVFGLLFILILVFLNRLELVGW